MAAFDNAAPPDRTAIFASLVERFGLNAALSLLPLLNPDSSDTSKAFAGVNLAGTGARVAGGLSGTPALSSLGRGIGTAAGLAGTGFSLYNTATSPNLSTPQKIGHSNQIAGEAALSLGVPYAGLGILAKHIIGTMERSKSPQVSGVARGIAYPARPVEGLLSVLSGDKSPRGAVNSMVSQARNTPGLKGLVNPVFDLLGLGTKPTTGTMFRKEAGSIFDRIPALKSVDTSRYNIPLDSYNALPSAARDAAQSIAGKIAPLASHSRSNPDAYKNQVVAMLLNAYGARLPSMASGIKF